jgi:hypothetical protein
MVKLKIIIVVDLVCVEWVEDCEFFVPKRLHFLRPTLNADCPERKDSSAKGTPL